MQKTSEKNAITSTERGLDPQPNYIPQTDAVEPVAEPHADSGVRHRDFAVRKNVNAVKGIDTSANHRDPSRARALFDRTLLQPVKPVNEGKLTWRRCAVNVVRYSWLNVLLVFVPISWAMHFSGQTSTVVFVTSALAIIPCAALLSFATEELAIRVGSTLGGLLNATFGNVVELIIAILALVKGEIRVVQSAMVGSILSNCLLVLGCAFFAGGLRYHTQGYKLHSAQINISMLGLSTASIVIPAAYHAALSSSLTNTPDTPDTLDSDILALSHGVAIILLITYACFLLFQLWTHAYMYDDATAPKVNSAIVGPDSATDRVDNPTGGNNVFRLPSWSSSRSTSSSDDGHDDDEEEPKLTVLAAFALIIGVTVVTGFTAEWLVSSLEGLVNDNGISQEFVALILLPLIGNAAEHVTAVTVSIKNKLDLSVQIAVGSSIQIALFVLPFLVILGWGIGQPLTFFLDPFVTLTLFISILIVNWAIQDGVTNWLEGFGLMMAYVIIALSFWYYDVVE